MSESESGPFEECREFVSLSSTVSSLLRGVSFLVFWIGCHRRRRQKVANANFFHSFARHQTYLDFFVLT